MSPDLAEWVVAVLSALVLLVLVAGPLVRRSAARVALRLAAGTGSARPRVVYSESDPPLHYERWVADPFADAAGELYGRDFEVRVLGDAGSWEVGLVGSVFGSPVRVEVARRGSSTVFVGWVNYSGARLLDPSTGEHLRLSRRPNPVDDPGILRMAVQMALVNDSDGGVPNADVARLERLLDELPVDVVSRLLADGRLLRSRAAALALLDAVESGAPVEWALRRAERALA